VKKCTKGWNQLDPTIGYNFADETQMLTQGP